LTANHGFDFFLHYTISKTQGLNHMDMAKTFLNIFSMEMLAREGELSFYIYRLVWLLLT